MTMGFSKSKTLASSGVLNFIDGAHDGILRRLRLSFLQQNLDLDMLMFVAAQRRPFLK